MNNEVVRGGAWAPGRVRWLAEGLGGATRYCGVPSPSKWTLSESPDEKDQTSCGKTLDPD